MAGLIELRNAHKGFGEQVILDNVSAVFHDSQKVGMIGRNGVGKSTLARILLGEEDLDVGEVVRSKTLRLGYLHQHDLFDPHESVLAFLERDTGCPHWRCGEMAGRFELKGDALHTPIGNLSGGWQSRVKLAALLLHDPNLLLLDEPTNFLDLSTQMLLEKSLRSFNGGCIVISHDRAFLRAVCTHTMALSRGKMDTFPGTVDGYLKQKQMQEEEIARTNVKVQAKRKQLQTFINKNRAGANTASQAKNKQKQMDRLAVTQLDAPEATVGMHLPSITTRSGTALMCDDLAIGYPEHTVARDIRLDFPHGERVAIVGDNGQGKTTFLRTITESLSAQQGTMRWGYGCEIGVYAQHVYTSLPEHLTVQEYLASRATAQTPTQTVLNMAGSFLFRGEAMRKSIRVLSGGERARLCLASLFLKGHNVLVLDEPVNHLDVETTGELAEALLRFQGTVVFTSHDRTFMERIATQVVEVHDERVETYPGDYTLYVERMRKRYMEDAPDNTKKNAASSATENINPPGKIGARERYRVEKEIQSLERQIERQQQSITALAEKMLQHTDWQALHQLHENEKAMKEELSRLENDWLTLQEILN